MTIVDAGEHLLHEDGGVTLRELSTGKNFIEEFATFADFCYKVVAFLIFEKFVHLNDIGMVLHTTATSKTRRSNASQQQTRQNRKRQNAKLKIYLQAIWLIGYLQFPSKC
jgi:hypothetical protein